MIHFEDIAETLYRDAWARGLNRNTSVVRRGPLVIGTDLTPLIEGTAVADAVKARALVAIYRAQHPSILDLSKE